MWHQPDFDPRQGLQGAQHMRGRSAETVAVQGIMGTEKTNAQSCPLDMDFQGGKAALRTIAGQQSIEAGEIVKWV